ncbi:MAG: HAD family hydrolase [Nanoarchaeota archaeon]
MSNIKAVIFDIGKVLADFDMDRAWTAFAKFTEIPASEMEGIVYETSDKEVLKYGTSKKDDIVKRYNTCNVDDARFREWMRERLQLRNITDEEFDQAWGDIFTTNGPVCGLVKKLSNNGYTLVALSDTNPIQMRYIMQTIPDTMRLFNGRVLTSFDIGVMKPDERTYNEAVKTAGVQSGEWVYVDDRKKYVSPVSKLGGHGIWYDWDNPRRDEILLKDLKDLGVRF